MPPVAPSIHQLLQIVRYILPNFQSEGSGSNSSITSDNLFSSDSFSDSFSDSAQRDPRLVQLRQKLVMSPDIVCVCSSFNFNRFLDGKGS